jgi:hypothetical protein
MQVDSTGVPSQKQTGQPNLRGGYAGEAFVSELMPQYYSLVKQNRVFSVSAAAINPSAYVGAAAGTPIFGLFNPSGSPVDLVLLSVELVIRSLGSAAVNSGTAFWSVNQGGVAVTGTSTAPKNMYTQSASGSQATAMVNTANTGALAAGLVKPHASIQTVASQVEIFGDLCEDIKGKLVVPPGGYLAYGLVAALTSGSIDAALIWAELPA